MPSFFDISSSNTTTAQLPSLQGQSQSIVPASMEMVANQQQQLRSETPRGAKPPPNKSLIPSWFFTTLQKTFPCVAWQPAALDSPTPATSALKNNDFTKIIKNLNSMGDKFRTNDDEVWNGWKSYRGELEKLSADMAPNSGLTLVPCCG
ncbi:MAG: hypothetical protein ACXU8A_06055 [Burkholderiaceae bacterium]